MATTPIHRMAEIDERFIREWVEYGLTEFATYLAKHAAFDAWLIAHPKEKT